MNPFLSVSRCFLLGPFLFFYFRKPHAKLIIERKRIDRTLLVLEDFALSQCFINSDIFLRATACVILGTLSALAFQIVRQFLRVSLRLDKPSEDRLVLTKVEKNIFMLAARVSPVALFGRYIHEITGMAATTWRLRPRFVSVAGDGAFLLDQDDFGARPDLFAAVGYLRPSKEKLLAAGGGQLPGIRGQTTH